MDDIGVDEEDALEEGVVVDTSAGDPRSQERRPDIVDIPTPKPGRYNAENVLEQVFCIRFAQATELVPLSQDSKQRN